MEMIILQNYFFKVIFNISAANIVERKIDCEFSSRAKIALVREPSLCSILTLQQQRAHNEAVTSPITAPQTQHNLLGIQCTISLQSTYIANIHETYFCTEHIFVRDTFCTGHILYVTLFGAAQIRCLHCLQFTLLTLLTLLPPRTLFT